MVSLEVIIAVFRKFMRNASKLEGKELKQGEMEKISRNIDALKELLEDKGYIDQAKKLTTFNVSLFKKRKIEEPELKLLREILAKIK